jgi:RimJ/RimL family protein N-acetyltransferase
MPVIDIRQIRLRDIHAFFARSTYEGVTAWEEVLDVASVDEIVDALTVKIDCENTKGFGCYLDKWLAGVGMVRHQLLPERRHVYILALLIDPGPSRSCVAVDLVRALQRWLADTGRYYRIEAVIKETELPLLEALEKCGFVSEVVRRKSVIDEEGSLVDEYLLAYMPSRN